MGAPTYLSYFSGADLAGVGLQAAGYAPDTLVEYDPAIAEVAATNHPDARVLVADVTTVDPRKLERPSLFWVSPVCTRASRANPARGETARDLALADAICLALRTLTPPTFVLENVREYRAFKSFGRIVACLSDLGYQAVWAHVNSADCGGIVSCPIHDTNSLISGVRVVGSNSPCGTAADIVGMAATMRPDDQARILAWDVLAHLVRATAPGTVAAAPWLAADDPRPQGPITTHGRAGDTSMIAAMSGSASMANIGASIESWLSRSSDDHSLAMRWSTTSTEIRQTTIQLICACTRATARTQRIITPSDAGNACPLCSFKSVPQTRIRLILRAVRGGLVPHLPAPVPWRGWYGAIADLVPTLPESKFAAWQLARLDRLADHTLVNQRYDAPAMTITASDGDRAVRAFLVNGGQRNPDVRIAIPGNEPAPTVIADTQRCVTRAFLVATNGEGGDLCRQADALCQTITANHHAGKHRAFIVHPSDQRSMPVRDVADPIWTLTAGSNATRNPDVRPRAWLEEGRVVRMTTRALARFQSVPDSYVLPEKQGLASLIIGNGVACTVAQRIGEAFLRGS